MIKILSLLTIFFAFNAHAGPSSSGGGGGVLCKDSSGFETIRFFDLYSAESELGLTLLTPAGSIDSELQAVQERFQKIWHGGVPSGATQSAYSHFLDRFRPIPAGSRLPVLNDIGNTLQLPSNCKYVQIIRYNDGSVDNGSNDTADVDLEYWNRLSTQDRAALYTHEVTYSEYRRNFGSRNSKYIRRWVGYFFSTDGFESPDSGMPTSGPMLYCAGTPNTYFNAFQVCEQKSCVTKLQFINLFHVGLAEKVTATLGPDLFDKLEARKLKEAVDFKVESKSFAGVGVRLSPTPESAEHNFFLLEIEDPSISVSAVAMTCGIER